MDALKGKKTYIVAIAFVVYAALGVFIGQMDMDTAVMLMLNGGGFAALRAGIAKA